MATPRLSVAAASFTLLAALLPACSGLGGLNRLPDAQAVIADMQFPGSPLEIEASVNRAKRSYRTGEKIRLSVRLNRPAYVAILAVDKDGETRLLFPNKAHPRARLPAKVAVAIPGPRDDFAILAPRPGTLLIEAVASTSGESWLFHRAPGGSAIFADVGTTTHLLAKEIAAALKHGGAAAAAAAIVVRVKGE